MTGGQEREWSRYYRVPGRPSVGALHARFVSHHYPRHAHEYFVVGLVDRGAQSYWYRGARHVTPAGGVFIVAGGEAHTGEPATPAGYTYRTLYPCAVDLARLVEQMSGRASVPAFSGAVLHDAALAALLARCHRVLAARRTSLEGEARWLDAMTRLIAVHADSHTAPRMPGRERPAVARARAYLEAHFADDVSLSDLARVASLSPFYLARTFAREVGLPPHAYLESVRLRRAREMLDDGMSPAETAISVGYADQSHLTHRFRWVLGVTPGQYAGRQDSTRRGPSHLARCRCADR